MKSIPYVFLWAILIGYAILDARRVAQWADEVSLFEAAVKTDPCAARPHARLANLYAEHGQTTASFEEWVQAVHLSVTPCER